MDLEDLFYLFGLGVTAFVATKAGENRAYERVKQEHKDMEIDRLRAEINEMKRQVAFNNTNFKNP